MTEDKILLIGCGILKREIGWLIKKNNWELDTLFLDSALHVNFKELSENLKLLLYQNRYRSCIVFYGACHPLMQKILKDANTFRTDGQNCVEMLLGKELFFKELSQGAFFLLEDWVVRWEYIWQKTFGTNQKVMQEIFRGDRTYMLCLKTPCSENYYNKAEEIGKNVGLPLRWLDVSLDNLELVLKETITRKMQEESCQR